MSFDIIKAISYPVFDLLFWGCQCLFAGTLDQAIAVNLCVSLMLGARMGSELCEHVVLSILSTSNYGLAPVRGLLQAFHNFQGMQGIPEYDTI